MPIRLVTVSGPRGAGKNTIQNALLENIPGMRCIVPHTTRPPRPLEQDGREYHFVSLVEFAHLVERGEFVWHGRVGPTQRSGTVTDEFLIPANCSVVDVLPSGARAMRSRILAMGGSVLHLLVLAPPGVRRRRIAKRDPSKSPAEVARLMREDPVSADEMNRIEGGVRIDNSGEDPEPACAKALFEVEQFLATTA